MKAIVRSLINSEGHLLGAFIKIVHNKSFVWCIFSFIQQQMLEKKKTGMVKIF